MELKSLALDQFVGQVASGNPTPGGGSVGALCGALGAALARMVCGFTVGREKFKNVWDDLESVKRDSEKLMERFLDLVQRDTNAYQDVLKAFGRPKETDEDRRQRSEAIQTAMKGAASVPLETLRAASELLPLCETAIRKGNPNTVTDGGVAAQAARAAAFAAAYNVWINLGSVRDEEFVAGCQEQVAALLSEIDQGAAVCDRLVRDRL